MTHQITLHYFGFTESGGKSDKIYILTIEQQHDGCWSINAQWGRRGGKMSSQNKGIYESHWDSVLALNNLAYEKISKGYLVVHKTGKFVGDKASV